MANRSRSEFDNEQFISEVKKHPMLWDLNHKDFNHRQAKQTAWEEVAANLYFDWCDWSNYERFGKVRDFQKRWKNIRDSYIKDLKYEKRAEKGMVLAKKRKYVYSHLLTFMTIEKTPKQQSLPVHSSSSGTDNEETDADPQNNNRTDFTPTFDEGYFSNHLAKTEAFPLPEHLPEQHSLRNISEHSSHCPPSGEPSPAQPLTLEQDDDKMFLLSLLPYFKKFSEERKLEARIAVARLVHDRLYKQM